MGERVYTVTGEKVALGPLERELAPLIHRWRNDLWIQRTYGGGSTPTTNEQQAAWLEQSAASDAIWFAIYERATERPIGMTDLFGIERDHGLAWWGMVIGEPDARGKGYASETASLMLDYAFTLLNLHVVMLTVDEFNVAGRRAYARAGFKEAGRIRQATLVTGRRYDRIVMDCLASEFTSPVLRALLDPEAE